MALISPTIPTIGQPNSTEDQDVANALTTIVAAINGGLDTANLAAAAGVTAAQLTTAVQAAAGLNGVSTRRGKCIIATEESRTNTAYGLMTTPDRVQNIVLPTDGLIFVAYSALFKESGINAARAAIFVGSNQLKAWSLGVPAPVVQETDTGTSGGSWYVPLTTNTYGLFGGGLNNPGGDASAVTTGQVVGAGLEVASGPVAIFAAAGTYDISVQFKASSGSVTAKERKLWVWSAAFD